MRARDLDGLAQVRAFDDVDAGDLLLRLGERAVGEEKLTIARGVKLQGSYLQPSGNAATVRTRDGELLVTDGPFAETKEQIAGFDIIECADLHEALRIAGAHPTTRHGTIEIRPFPAE